MINPHLTQQAFTIAHASDISAARRAGQQLADSLGFDETSAGRLAIIITEAATNILKHAGDGVILLTPLYSERVEVVALDQGPGIANLNLSLLDGISTTGTYGNGLGAMRRLADDFDIYTQAGKGTALYMSVRASTSPPTAARPLEFGVVCIPKHGEEACGDAWSVVFNDDAATALVVDGLGHGHEAAEAARAAVSVLQERSSLSPQGLLEAAHPILYGTRGAALAAAEFRFDSGTLHYAGVGNISACVLDYEFRKQLMSHNGIVGHTMRKVQQISMPWTGGALYVMHSDGLGTQWNLNQYPGLYLRHPALVAAVLFRDYARGRDDVTVLVVRSTQAR